MAAATMSRSSHPQLHRTPPKFQGVDFEAARRGGFSFSLRLLRASPRSSISVSSGCCPSDGDGSGENKCPSRSALGNFDLIHRFVRKWIRFKDDMSWDFRSFYGFSIRQFSTSVLPGSQPIRETVLIGSRNFFRSTISLTRSYSSNEVGGIARKHRRRAQT